MDAKFTNTYLSREINTRALFCQTIGRTWQPSDAERKKYPEVTVSGQQRLDDLFSGADPCPTRVIDTPSQKTIAAVDLHQPSGRYRSGLEETETPTLPHVPAWHGTLLARTDADTWLAAGFADYEPIVAREKALQISKGQET